MRNMTKKSELVNYLSENAKSIKDKSLKDRIAYTLKAFKKDEKSVAVLDLRALVKETDSLLTAPAAVETSIKKPTTASKSKLRQSSKAVKPETAKETEAEASTPKKTLKKSTPKKTEAKKPVEKFPEVLDLKDLRLKKLPVKDFNALYKELEADKRIYFAAEWTPEQLKEYDYNMGLNNIETPKSFKFNLDILSLLYLGDNNTIGIAVSDYTDMPYTFNPSDVKARVMNEIPFEIYEAV